MLEMRSIEDISKEFDDSKELLGFERVKLIHGSSYKDCSTVIIVPTRGMIHHSVAQSWLSLIGPMNQKRAMFFAAGHEVGEAYNELIKNILAEPRLSTWKYILTLEDDNIIPPDAHLKLLESIELGPFDAVGGLYFTKGDVNMPMAYGNPHEYRQTGQMDFKPRDVVQGISTGTVVEVNGLAMGCTLWRMSLFKEFEPPWYVTVSDIVPDKGIECMTQDLYFCRRARAKAKRFAVDLRVHVGHLDVENEIVY
jgi:hypothetical protein